MIKVFVFDNGLLIKGHAEYDEHGKDIVCAGVSALAYATLNSIEKVAQLFDVKDDEERLSLVTDHIKKNKNVDLLLQHFYEGVRMIEEQYKEYVKVEDCRYE